MSDVLCGVEHTKGQSCQEKARREKACAQCKEEEEEEFEVRIETAWSVLCMSLFLIRWHFPPQKGVGIQAMSVSRITLRNNTQGSPKSMHYQLQA